VTDQAKLPDLFAGVNSPKDPSSLTDLEKKHLPVITAPESVKAGECFEVTVEVGKLLDHPNEIDHYIEFLQLYAGDTYLARLDLTSVRTCPVLKVCVSLDQDLGPLRAFERCNKHGAWEAQKPIRVEA
jgi:superoxide reductase